LSLLKAHLHLAIFDLVRNLRWKGNSGD